MHILGGCEEKNRTPVLEERICPVCGEEVEVFTVQGRLVDEFVCDCGHVFPKEEQITPETKRHTSEQLEAEEMNH